MHKDPISEGKKPELIRDLIEKRRPSTEPDTTADKTPIAITYAGFLGLDIAAASGVEGVLLADINPAQKLFWQGVIELLKECPTKGAFNARLFVLEKEQQFELRKEGKKDPENYPRFHENDDAYAHLHQLAKNDMIAPVVMDVLDTERFMQLHGLMKDTFTAEVVYLSNIRHFLDRANYDVDFYNRTLSQEDPEICLQNHLAFCHNASTIITAELAKGLDIEDDAQPPDHFFELQTSSAKSLADAYMLTVGSFPDTKTIERF